MSKKSPSKASLSGQALITLEAPRTMISRLKALLQRECQQLGITISIKPLDGKLRVTCSSDDVEAIRELVSNDPAVRFRIA